MFRLCLAISITLAGSLTPDATGEHQPDRLPVSVVAELIEQAAPGSILQIPAGVYEGNLIVRKSIGLDGSAGAVFDGLGLGTVIEVLADSVTIRNCTIRASGQDVTGEPSAIRVVAGKVTIEANTIEDYIQQFRKLDRERLLAQIDAGPEAGKHLIHQQFQRKDS